MAGPFPIGVLVVFAAVLVAWAIARVMARHRPAVIQKASDGMILDSVLWGFMAARLGYIVQWWEDYSATPRSIIAVGDGGFSWWVGVLAALALVWWRTRSHRALRRPVLIGIAAGVLSWFAAGGVLDLTQRPSPPLPALELATLDGRPVNLGAYAGRPVVLNLWASWCPPCRREMPVFEQAQAQFPHVAFVLVNQGESAQQARAFLAREHLTFKDVLLDPSSQAMHAMGTRGLPTTLFFDAQGRLVDTHLGELTMASLKHAVSRRFPPFSRLGQTRE